MRIYTHNIQYPEEMKKTCDEYFFLPARGDRLPDKSWYATYYIYIYIHMCIYIYIYREREREMYHTCMYIYVYIYIHLFMLYTHIYMSKIHHHRLPDGVGTNAVFAEGPQVQNMLQYLFLSAHLLPDVATYFYMLRQFAYMFP